MTRAEFIKVTSLLGISLPFASVLHACTDNDDNIVPLSADGKVLIVGAGPAGITAGYLLAQQGIDFQIIEATEGFGGRIKHTRDFAQFPISLGGEWIHVAPSILSEAVNDSSIRIDIQTQGYDLQKDMVGFFDGTNLSFTPLAQDFGSDFIDQKFVDSSWLDFFETYLIPSIAQKTTFNTPVQSVQYSSDQVTVTAADGTEFTGDKVIVTVPIKILQTGGITFDPPLPSDKQNAINNLKVWDGFKAFFTFSEKFYPTFLSFPDSETAAGQRLYYDAGYAQTSGEHVLGLFTVGEQANAYQNLSGDAQRDYILNELDTTFGNSIASDTYVKHILQNWNAQPYAQGAYITDQENWRLVRTMGEPLGNSLLFAGDAYTNGEDWSSVHTAIRSAKTAVARLVG